MPDREGVTYESPFVGPGMRGHSGLRYFPCRLSLVPALLSERPAAGRGAGADVGAV